MSNPAPTLPPLPSTIANLPSATTPLNAADVLPISQGGVTKNVTAAQLATAVAANTITGGNGISASTTGGVTTVSLAALPSADILVGNGSNVATAVVVSGDLTLANTGAFTVAKIAGVAVGTPTGTGNVVFSNSPTLVTPALGTPASGVGTNLTGTAAGLTAGNVMNVPIMTALGVGAIMLAEVSGGSQINVGVSTAASNLSGPQWFPTTGGNASVSGDSITGTWQAMQTTPNSRIGLFQRTA